MTDSVVLKLLQDNECAIYGCFDSTTSEGLMCSRHWRMLPGVMKEQYVWAKKQALLAVKAAEEIKKDLG